MRSFSLPVRIFFTPQGKIFAGFFEICSKMNKFKGDSLPFLLKIFKSGVTYSEVFQYVDGGNPKTHRRQDKTMKKFMLGMIIFAIAGTWLLAGSDNLPESREATLVETTSPTEVMVRAAGIGHHDPKGLFKHPDPKVMNQRAEVDAMKSGFPKNPE